MEHHVFYQQNVHSKNSMTSETTLWGFRPLKMTVRTLDCYLYRIFWFEVTQLQDRYIILNH